MASIFGHVLASFAFGKGFSKSIVNWKFLLLGIGCAILPDADVIGFSFGIKYGSFWGHRGFSHSHLFAFILGFLIYGLVLFTWGDDVLPTENAKYGMYADSFAIEMGFQTGDKLVSIDNKPLENFNSIRLEIFKNESKTAQVIRDGESISFDIPEELTGGLASYKGTFIIPRFPFVIDSIYPEYPAGKSELKVLF